MVVLQTGSPLEFRGETLADTLGETYRWFGDDTYDPAQLGVLLRFDDEPLRSGHILSWRIYAEPEYANALIDIQRDWHYAAYGTAIEKTKAIIAGGDHDTANYRELSGLYRAISQWDLAADTHAEAIKRTPESDAFSRAVATIELIQFEVSAERFDSARSNLTNLLEQQLPALGPSLEEARLQIGVELIGALGDAPELRDERLDVAQAFLLTELRQRVNGTVNFLTGNNFSQRRWDNSNQWRWQLSMAYSQAIIILQDHTPAEIIASPVLEELAVMTERYAAIVTPFMSETAIEHLDTVFSAATHAYAMLGRDAYLTLAFARLASDQPYDLSLDGDLHSRSPVFAQHMTDLDWVVTAPEFYANNLAFLFDDSDNALALEQAEQLIAHLPAARARRSAWYADDHPTAVVPECGATRCDYHQRRGRTHRAHH